MEVIPMDLRDVVFDTLCEIASYDKDVVLITADADAFGIRKFKKLFPSRFFDVGVAEQNMVNVAAGMALSGKKVFICALGPFATLRCFEQIKTNVCGMNLHVVIIAIGIGLSFGFDGPTHHAVCDIGVMSNLPEMSIYNPIDPYSTAHCVKESYEKKSPSYIRVDKGTFPPLHCKSNKLSKGADTVLGNCFENKEIVVVSTGICSQYALSYPHSAKVVDWFRIKPLDREWLLYKIQGYKKIITFEEHVKNSGIGSIIANLIVEEGLNVELKKIALPDIQWFGNGDREYLHSKHKIDKWELRNWTGYIT